MKKYILLLLFPFYLLLAQAPHGFNYQAVVSNTNGQLIINKNVLFKFNITQNSPTFLPIFSETHQVATDDLGQANLIIGQGTATIGSFTNINWGSNTCYLSIELNTGNGFIAMGTTQLLSVPFALYANQSNNTQSSVYDLNTILTKNNDANDQKIVNLANPTNPKDMVNLDFMNSLQNQFNNQKNQIEKFDSIIKNEITKPLTIQWQKSLGGSKNDEINGAQKTTDGGFVIAGSVSSTDGDVIGNHSSNYDIWVVKTDGSGTIQWKKTFGGSNSDTAECIKNTSDGGYIITGTTFSTDGDVTGNKGNGDIWVIKINATGGIQWQKTFGGSKTDIAAAIEQNPDGSYYILGSTYSNDGDVTQNTGEFDFWVLKINVTGTIQWQKTFGSTTSDLANKLQLTNDGAILISGNSFLARERFGFSPEIYILKINSNGVLQWQKTFGGASEDYVNQIISTNDGGYLFGGYSSSTDGDLSENLGDYDMWVVKITASGTLSWKKSIGGVKWDLVNSLKETSEGGYIVIGETASVNNVFKEGKGLIDIGIVKLSSNGKVEWTKTIGGSGAEKGIEVIQATDGNFFVFGNSNSTDKDISNNNGNSDIFITKLKIN
ncbi:MAG: hypothetical protein KA210_01845 [Bacteroidia bacterium]|nr:hypothetical protein [Bacteroidia bacterium]